MNAIPDSPSRAEAYRRLREELAAALPAATTEDEVYEAAVSRLHRLPGFDWTGVYVMEGSDTLRLGPYLGEATEHVRIPVGRGICGQSAERDETVIVDDVRAQSNYLACSLDTRSEIVIPIRVGGRYHAQIDVDSHTPAAFQQTDRRNLEAVADVLSLRIAELIEEAHHA